ncbi:hypothetical protein OAN38_01700 [Candidatus Marinimicrobia bacterium]|nr:hypothetical protein [Candidatus Neomarinimicrobiota bacterium]
MNFLDTLCILFIILQFFISGCIFHSIFINNFKINDLVIIPRLLIFGIFFNVVYLQVWHLFLPVNITCAVLLHTSQLFFVLFHKKTFQYFKIFKSLSLYSYFFLLLFLIWISVLTNSPLLPSDSGLYHLPIIKWNSSYPLVKGLGNLSIDYGTNSNLFLLISLTKNYPFYLNFLWGFNGLFLFLGFVSFFTIPFEYIMRKSKKNFEIIYRILFIIPLVHYTFYFFPGTSTDLPVFIIGCIISIEFLLLSHKKSSYGHIIPILIFLGITIKTSILLFGLAVLFIYVIKIHSIKINLKSYFTKPTFSIFIISSLLWSARGVILSGYPLLPATFISLPVSWKIDKKDASVMHREIVNFAMPYDQNTPLKEKAFLKFKAYKSRLWVQHRRIEILYPFILGFIGLLYALNVKRKNNLIVLIPIIIQLALWLYIPKNRYSSFAAWWFFSHYFSLILERIISSKNLKYFIVTILLISILFHKVDFLGQEKVFFPQYLQKVIPVANLKDFKTTSGYGIFTLADKKEDQCWDSNLLCTPYPNIRLRPYSENDLSKGFYTLNF